MQDERADVNTLCPIIAACMQQLYGSSQIRLRKKMHNLVCRSPCCAYDYKSYVS